EMGHLEVTQRLLSAEARVDSSRMRNGRLQEQDWGKISHAIGRLGDAPLYIDENAKLTLMDVRAKSRRLKSKLNNELGLVVIDYLQLMTGRQNAENRQVEVAEIRRRLTFLCLRPASAARCVQTGGARAVEAVSKAPDVRQGRRGSAGGYDLHRDPGCNAWGERHAQCFVDGPESLEENFTDSDKRRW